MDGCCSKRVPFYPLCRKAQRTTGMYRTTSWWYSEWDRYKTRRNSDSCLNLTKSIVQKREMLVRRKWCHPMMEENNLSLRPGMQELSTYASSLVEDFSRMIINYKKLTNSNSEQSAIKPSRGNCTVYFWKLIPFLIFHISYISWLCCTQLRHLP